MFQSWLELIQNFAVFNISSFLLFSILILLAILIVSLVKQNPSENSDISKYIEEISQPSSHSPEDVPLVTEHQQTTNIIDEDLFEEEKIKAISGYENETRKSQETTEDSSEDQITPVVPIEQPSIQNTYEDKLFKTISRSSKICFQGKHGEGKTHLALKYLDNISNNRNIIYFPFSPNINNLDIAFKYIAKSKFNTDLNTERSIFVQFKKILETNNSVICFDNCDLLEHKNLIALFNLSSETIQTIFILNSEFLHISNSSLDILEFKGGQYYLQDNNVIEEHINVLKSICPVTSQSILLFNAAYNQFLDEYPNELFPTEAFKNHLQSIDLEGKDSGLSKLLKYVYDSLDKDTKLLINTLVNNKCTEINAEYLSYTLNKEIDQIKDACKDLSNKNILSKSFNEKYYLSPEITAALHSEIENNNKETINRSIDYISTNRCLSLPSLDLACHYLQSSSLAPKDVSNIINYLVNNNFPEIVEQYESLIQNSDKEEELGELFAHVTTLTSNNRLKIDEKVNLFEDKINNIKPSQTKDLSKNLRNLAFANFRLFEITKDANFLNFAIQKLEEALNNNSDSAEIQLELAEYLTIKSKNTDKKEDSLATINNAQKYYTSSLETGITQFKDKIYSRIASLYWQMANHPECKENSEQYLLLAIENYEKASKELESQNISFDDDKLMALSLNKAACYKSLGIQNKEKDNLTKSYQLFTNIIQFANNDLKEISKSHLADLYTHLNEKELLDNLQAEILEAI